MQELDVFVAGRRCGGASTYGPLQVLPLERAQEVCEGRTDFVELEPLGGALARGAVVVVTAERGDRGLKTAQCHLATSLSEWLREEQEVCPGGQERIFRSPRWPQSGCRD